MAQTEAHRPWYKLHLITLIVLPLVAGALIWANVTYHTCDVSTSSAPNVDPATKETVVCFVSGMGEAPGWPFHVRDFDRPAWLWWLANGGVALLILSCAAFFCEYNIRVEDSEPDGNALGS